MRRVRNLFAALASPIRWNSRSPLVLAGAALILVAGLVHLFLSPEHFEEARYLGLLFLADFLGSMVAAFGIYRGDRWGWALGALVAGGAFVLYFLSRTVGLLGMEGESLFEPLGILSKAAEALFLVLCGFKITESFARLGRWALVGGIVTTLVAVPGVALAFDSNDASSSTHEKSTDKGAHAGQGKKTSGLPVRWTATSPAIHLGDQYTLDVTNTSDKDQKLQVRTMIMDHKAKKNTMVVDEPLTLMPGEESELTAANDYGDANHFQTSVGSQTQDTKDLGLAVKVTDSAGNDKAWFNQEAFLIQEEKKNKDKQGKQGKSKT
jgi:hypothetical protein